ncbi:hypothetical protein N752_27980 [Desulforamulus aquiferis]|nr:methyl-accepting chemotaxis protein [Desulforamulus aquiferis]RYD01849.1 hypothetical protein N752_27980 [Desulforamulus aquiferis]
MKMLIGQDLLDAFIKVSPYLNSLILQDVAVGVYDIEQVLAYQSGESLDTHERVGDPITPGGAVFQSIRDRVPKMVEVGPEVYGVPFKAYCVPVFNEDNQVIGAVAMGTSLDNQKKLELAINQFHSSFINVNGNIQAITDGASYVSNISEQLTEGVDEAIKELNHSDEILNTIKKISDQTKLLGLNAAIEAARQGSKERALQL